ncbi:MAG: CRISPR-associated endonuclease Cas2 [Minicystis sp.]
MWVLVTYDVRTDDAAGRRRLRRVAKACEAYGHRVQKSVFECQVDDATWALLRGRLLKEYDVASDSLRFYFLGENGPARMEHHGINPSLDMEGPLVL